MSMSVFFLSRRFSDQSFPQAFWRGGLGGGSLLGLFLLGLSVLFLGLGGGTAAFAQSEKNYLGAGLGVIPFSTDVTGMWDDPQLPSVSDSGDGIAPALSLSYIRAITQSFWIAPSLSLGIGEVEYEEVEGEEVENGDISYVSLDVHTIYKTPSPLFIGWGLGVVYYEEELNPELFGDDETTEVSGVAPSVCVGFLFHLGSGALMLDAVWRGEVRSDFEQMDLEDDTLEGELSVTSYQISLSYLFHF